MARRPNSGAIWPDPGLRPARQEPSVARRDRALSLGPGHLLDLDAAVGTIDTAHGVDEEDQDSPERNELKAPGRKRVVGRPPLPAAGACGPAAHSRTDVDLEFDPVPLDEMCVAVDETRVFLDLVQDSLQLYPVCSSLCDVGLRTTSFQVGARDALH